MDRIVKIITFYLKAVVVSLFPVLKWLPRYDWKRDLLYDILTGFTVAVMHIPQGMAYAMLSEVPSIVGIYTAFFPVFIYFLMGTSRHISMGTFAVLCMMSAKTIIFHSSSVESRNSSLSVEGSDPASDEERSAFTPTQVGAILSFTVGAWQLVLGVCRLGVLSALLSETLVSGLTSGAAVHVLTSQIKNILGIKIISHRGPLKVIYTYIDVFQNVSNTNIPALIISAVAIFILVSINEFVKPYVMRRFSVPVPIEFALLVIGTLASTYGNLEKTYDIHVVGEIPKGFPAPSTPPFELLSKVILDGFLIAIVAFSTNMSMASIFARKHDYSVHANQELVAYGCSNIFGSFFSCIPFAASLSRSLIQESVGGKTQLASVVSCSLLLLILLVIGPFFESLPNSVLASIVVVSLKGMFLQIEDFPGACKYSNTDGCVWLITFLSVVLIDIDYGLAIGVSVSLFCVVIMGKKASVTELDHVEGTDLYLDSTRYIGTKIPGVIIIQISGGLNFANKGSIRRKIYKYLEIISVIFDKRLVSEETIEDTKIAPALKDILEPTEDETTVSEKPYQIHGVILDITPLRYIDRPGAEIIVSINNYLMDKDVLFLLVNYSAAVYGKLRRLNFFNDFPETSVFSSIDDAVKFVHQMFED